MSTIAVLTCLSTQAFPSDTSGKELQTTGTIRRKRNLNNVLGIIGKEVYSIMLTSVHLHLNTLSFSGLPNWRGYIRTRSGRKQESLGTRTAHLEEKMAGARGKEYDGEISDHVDYRRQVAVSSIQELR